MNRTPSLVALTPAHNEAPHMEALIESVVAQTIRPSLWIIVNDASSDGTGSIAERLAEEHPFIQVLHRDRSDERRLSAKADAVNHAYEIAKTQVEEIDFVASIDADVQLPPTTFTFLMDKFAADPKLGISGGVYEHPVNGQPRINATGPVHVPGPLQVFRREVFETIGGYQSLPYGGLDTVSTAQARMLGWRTKAFDELVISHRRRVGTGGGRHPVAAEFHVGIRDYSLGTGFLFQLAKCARRVWSSPRLIGAIARLAGYMSFVIRRRERSVPEDLAKFIREEQYERLKPGKYRQPVLPIGSKPSAPADY